MNKTTIVALTAALICTFCTEDEEGKILAVDQCRKDNQERFCTANLAAIPVYLEDQNGNPIALDRFIVTNGDDYYDEKIPSETDRSIGRYIIFSDNEARIIEIGGSEFLFTGMINDEAIVSKSYTIGYDCCHVFLLSEGDTIRINT